MLTLEEIVAAVEESHGEVFDSEEQCPGVYYLACRPLDTAFSDELVVVERNCPHISAAAKAYGEPLDGHDELLAYDFNDERGGRDVVFYEAYRYLMLHQLPIPDNSTLLSSAAYSADDYPEYFGPTPAPVVTPAGYMTRYIALANGVFALETDIGARLIALAGIVWSVELSPAVCALGERIAGKPMPDEVTYLFFSEQNGCLALFELLHGLSDPTAHERLDLTALMNAIWQYHPEHALSHNLREQQGLNDMLGMIMNAVGAEVELSGSAENMIVLTESAGVEYIRW